MLRKASSKSVYLLLILFTQNYSCLDISCLSQRGMITLDIIKNRVSFMMYLMPSNLWNTLYNLVFDNIKYNLLNIHEAHIVAIFIQENTFR